MPCRFSNSRIRLSQGQLFWREAGQGQTLVFLHGASHDSSQWLPLLERLSRDRHCLAPDLLGFGDSERPDVHYSIQLQVECLAEYLAALHLENVVLVGHSLGGWVAASYALQHKQQVQGLILFSPLGVETEESQNQWRLEPWLIGSFPLVFWLLRSLRPLAKLLGFRAKIDRLLEYRQQLLQFPTACQLLFQRRQAEITAEFLDNRLEFLKVPTLILQGDRDTPSSLAKSQAYGNLIPAAKLRSIDRGDRNLPEMQPDPVAEEIRQFLAVVPEDVSEESSSL